MKTSRVTVLKQIKRYVMQQKGSALALIVISAITIPVALAPPRFFQILIDRVFTEHNSAMFWVVVIGLLSVYIARFLLDGGNLFFGNRLLNRFSFNLRMDLFNKYQACPFSFLAKHDTGDLKMRIMEDVDCLGSFIKNQIVDYVFSIFMICLSLLLCLRLSWKMSLYCLVVIPIIFLINYIIGNGTKRVNDESRQVTKDYYTWTYDSLQCWREVKAQRAEISLMTRFRRYRDILAKLGLRSIRYWAYSEIFNDFKANYLTRVMVYIIGALFVIYRKLTVGELMMFAEYFALLFGALDTINQKNMELRMNTPYYQRIFETLQFPEEQSSRKKTFKITGNIAVQSVTFGYLKEHTVLEQLEFSIRPGETLAVIGKSGCGKTTLAKLLLGLCEPRNGVIRYDGVPLTCVNHQTLYSQIGVVLQDSFLYDMTILENLCLANPDASNVDIEQVCTLTNILSFIYSLPQGFDTVVGERGVKLSGGQKQRLCIARALLKRPKLLILDEATNALDQESEDLVSKSIREISEHMTVILIAHNPSVILSADRVMVIEDKKIVDIGTHDELLERNSYYRTIMA